MASATAIRSSALGLEVLIHDRDNLAGCLPRLGAYVLARGATPLSRHPSWLTVLDQGLGHAPYCLEAVVGGRTRGILPLAYIRSLLFGRFLVGLPYLNSGGVMADDERVESALIDGALDLANRLDARHLELRHERATGHPTLGHRACEKVHMRLSLPSSAADLWARLSAKVRNQVRKGQKGGLTIAWGGRELLPEFYAVFSRNMRDLGTPVYGPELFRCAIDQFPGRAELCVIRAQERAIAAAFLLHGWGVSEVPSASSLRRYNHTNANMLMYWSLLERAVQRSQETFDFGRSSRSSNSYRFKKQWGAEPIPAVWEYHIRTGSPADVRPENPRFRHLIRLWQRLPLGLTRLIGPLIVRGIP